MIAVIVNGDGSIVVALPGNVTHHNDVVLVDRRSESHDSIAEERWEKFKDEKGLDSYDWVEPELLPEVYGGF